MAAVVAIESVDAKWSDVREAILEAPLDIAEADVEAGDSAAFAELEDVELFGVRVVFQPVAAKGDVSCVMDGCVSALGFALIVENPPDRIG